MKLPIINMTDETEGQREAEVLLYGVIGEDFEGGMTGQAFADQLKSFGSIDNITVRINSIGGNVFDGSAIYNALKNHPARVKVEIEGIAASAASYVAMAGDEIVMDENALLMIHQAMGGLAVFARSQDITDAAKQITNALDKIDGQISKIYADRTHRRQSTFMDAMEKETWYTAEEAKEMRLVDTIRANKKRPIATFSPEAFNRISKRPERIAALLQQAPEDPPADLNDEELEVIEGPLDVAPEPTVEQTLEVINAKLAEYSARAAQVVE